MRKLFESQHESLDVIIVEVSERVRTLGQIAQGMLQNSLAVTRLTSHNERFTKQDQIIEALLDDHESMIRELSKESPGAADEKVDIDAADFMAGLLGQHEKMAGALRGWL